MIINTGQRTDIPAFYAEWFANRIKAGFVCVRNPYYPSQVSRYRLYPSVVDVIGFCTKNPAPIFPHMNLLKAFGQFWFVTITPYGRDIEPNVPDKHSLLDDFKRLSDIVGINAIGWRYDPIFISARYTAEYHLPALEKMASALDGYVPCINWVVMLLNHTLIWTACLLLFDPKPDGFRYSSIFYTSPYWTTRLRPLCLA